MDHCRVMLVVGNPCHIETEMDIGSKKVVLVILQVCVNWVSMDIIVRYFYY